MPGTDRVDRLRTGYLPEQKTFATLDTEGALVVDAECLEVLVTRR